MTSNSKIVITGSSGYLAGRIIQHLQSFPELEINAISRKKLPDIFEQFPSVHQVIGEMTEENTWDKISEVDYLIHLAAPNEMVCTEAPLESLTAHIKNTWQLIEQAHKKGLKRMIYMSTIHVYGSPLSGKISEDTIPQPNHPYALMHHAAEEAASYLSKKLGFELLIFRLSNAFGAPLHPFTDRWKLLVNDLCKEAVEKGSITLKSSGRQKRNFIPISSVLIAMKKAIQREEICPGTYNLCSGFNITVMEMAERIKQVASEILNKSVNLIVSENSVESSLEYEINSNFEVINSLESFSNWDTEIIDTMRLWGKSHF